MRDVTVVDMSTSILGHASSMPIYIVGILFSLRDYVLISCVDCDGSREARTPRRRIEFDPGGSKTQCNPNGMLLAHSITRLGERLAQIPTLSSCSFDELVDAAQPGQVQFFQLYAFIYPGSFSCFTHETPRYVNKDRAVTKRIVQQAERRGIKALFITVDAPQLGRREKVGSSSVKLEMRELKT